MIHYEVRFHLGAGANYKHWQVKMMHKNEKYGVLYFDPEQFQLVLSQCQLINKENLAKKVFESQVRSVCGWVRCDRVYVRKLGGLAPLPIARQPQLVYDPKIKTYWHYADTDRRIDNKQFRELITIGKRVFRCAVGTATRNSFEPLISIPEPEEALT